MKEKVISFLKSDFFFAAATNLLIMAAVIFITSFSYDTINDLYNSMFICHYHYYYNNDINYILAVIVGSVQYILTDINCYVLGMVGLSYIAFTSITYVFADKFKKIKALVFTVFINTIFSLSHYANVESSKTAAILLIAGFLLILNAIRNKRYNLPFWLGVAEISIGSFYNYEYFFIALGFALMYFAADLIAKRKYKIAFRKFFWYFRPFLLCFAFITLIVFGLNQYTVSVNNSSAEASDYYEYCQLTDSISNLPYPNYKDYQNEFNEVGIFSENEYELLKSGYYDNSNSLNNNALKLVQTIQQQNNSKTIYTEFGNIFLDIAYDFSIFNSNALNFVFIVLIIATFLIMQKKRYAFFPIFYLIAALASGTYLRYAFNGSSYLTYGIWLFITVMLLYSFDFEHMRDYKTPMIFTKLKGRLCISLAVMLAFIGGTVAVYMTHNVTVNTKSRPTGLYLEISRHPERYYVIDPVTFESYIKYSNNYIHPMWGFSNSFLKNVDTFGYFQKTEQRRNRGLSDNIYKAAINNRYVYVIDNTITYKKEKYFTKYYSNDDQYISYIQSEENSGYKIYKVVAQ